MKKGILKLPELSLQGKDCILLKATLLLREII